MNVKAGLSINVHANQRSHIAIQDPSILTTTDVQPNVKGSIDGSAATLTFNAKRVKPFVNGKLRIQLISPNTPKPKPLTTIDTGSLSITLTDGSGAAVPMVDPPQVVYVDDNT
jgi:hypothetical protein